MTNKRAQTKTATILTPPQPSIAASSEQKTASETSISKRRQNVPKFYRFKNRENTANLILENGPIPILRNPSTMPITTGVDN